MGRMPCRLKIDRGIKQDALSVASGNPEACSQIDEFLGSLRSNPLPWGRQELSPQSFYVKLPCGIIVGWEIIGDMLKLVTRGPGPYILVRILGIVREIPRPPK